MLHLRIQLSSVIDDGRHVTFECPALAHHRNRLIGARNGDLWTDLDRPILIRDAHTPNTFRDGVQDFFLVIFIAFTNHIVILLSCFYFCLLFPSTSVSAWDWATNWPPPLNPLNVCWRRTMYPHTGPNVRNGYLKKIVLWTSDALVSRMLLFPDSWYNSG